MDERAACFLAPLLGEGAAFFPAPLDEAVGFLPAAGGCKIAVYFLMKELARSSVSIASLSLSIILITAAARFSA